LSSLVVEIFVGAALVFDIVVMQLSEFGNTVILVMSDQSSVISEKLTSSGD